jgi:hypothetical protein
MHEGDPAPCAQRPMALFKAEGWRTLRCGIGRFTSAVDIDYAAASLAAAANHFFLAEA